MKKKIRIAFLSFYQHQVDRGVERWLENLKSRLGPGFAVKVFCPKSVRFSQPLVKPGVWRRFFVDRNSLRVGIETVKLLPELRGFDLLLPLNGGWQTLLAKLAAKVYRRKMIVVGHAGLGFDDRWNLFCRPDLFVSLSEFQKQWASQFYSGRIKVIANGVDLNRFSPQGEKYPLKLKRPIVVWAAALQKSRFFKNLVLACLENQASLLLAGSGSRTEAEKIDCLAAEHLGQRYLRKPFKPEEMPQVYRTADLFVYLNPAWESFGLVFLEAMACNRPVIAGDDPIRKELVGRAGLLVKPESAKAVSRAVKQALAKDWGQAPRQQAENYSWQKTVDQYEKLFFSLKT